MDVEWDEEKRLINLESHGVDFKDAALIFERPVIEAEDTRESYGEKRWRALARLSAFLVGPDVHAMTQKISS